MKVKRLSKATMRTIIGRDILATYTGKKTLDVSSCSIEVILDDAFKGFGKLHHLNASNNSLSSMPNNVYLTLYTL